MAEREIEVILARQLSNDLVLPVFLADPEGNLIFYNEPAERILGRRFEETGEMPASEWSVQFRPTDPDGKPMPQEDLPPMRALQRRFRAHARLWILGLDGARRLIEVTAFPLEGMAGRFLHFAAQAGTRRLVPFHYDPDHADDVLDRLMAEVLERVRPSIQVAPGTEGSEFDLPPV